ncbi:MAG: glycosyl hydrolase family 65 protein, partial [Candidatus Thorarchaeota archaeon]
RYRRLDSAREYAKECGYEGAVFPWQSGLSGKEETQTLHLNPRSGEWGPDYSSLQRHVSLAVAYNIWYYFWFTNDNEFMENYGAEIFLEICKFWINKAEMNDQRTYKIRNIVGPDEFHEMLPNSTEEGLKDNSYTNIMVVWTLNRAFEILEILNRKNKEKIIKKLNLTNSELKKWRDVTKRLNIIISDEGVLAQFDGYFDLKELDWAHYRKKYGNIHRMDRILRAEGKNPDEYKVAKQADVLMTFYTLKPSKVREIVKSLGYNVQEDFLKINYDYYAKRTSHGSTMSKVVHSYLLSLLGRQEEAYEYYLDALKSDYIDIQGGTTGEGIHMGVMAGTVLLTLHLIAGLDLRSNEVCLNPNLVKALRSMKFNFNFRGDTYYFEVTHEKVRFFVTSMKKKEVTINIRGSNILVGTQTPDNSREWTEYTIASSAFKKLN